MKQLESTLYICCRRRFSSWSRSLLLISLVRDSFVTYFLLPVHVYVQWPFCRHFWHRTFSALGSLQQHIILIINCFNVAKKDRQLTSQYSIYGHTTAAYCLLHQSNHKAKQKLRHMPKPLCPWISKNAMYICTITDFCYGFQLDQLCNQTYKQVSHLMFDS